MSTLFRFLKKIFPIYGPGFSLLEIVLAGALLTVLVTASATALIRGKESARVTGERIRAAWFAQEGLAALTSLSDEEWTAVKKGAFGFTLVNNHWRTHGTSTRRDTFTGSVAVNPFSATTLWATSSVRWRVGETQWGYVELVGKITDWLRVTLGNWGLTRVTKTINITGNQDGLKVVVRGTYAYVVRDGGSPDFLIINIANPASPTVVGSLDLPGTPVALDVANAYAYVASADNATELQVISVINPAAPAVAATLDLAGTANATGIAADPPYAYLVRLQSSSPEFFVLNITSSTAPAIAATLNFSSDLNDVAIFQPLAFVASSANSAELTVVNIASNTLPASLAVMDLAGSSDARTVAAVSTTVAMGRASGVVAIINVAVSTTPQLLSTIDLGGAVNDLDFGAQTPYLWAATNISSKDLQVLNVTTPAAPSVVGTFNATSTLQGVVYYPLFDSAVAVGNDNNAEISIFKSQ